MGSGDPRLASYSRHLELFEKIVQILFRVENRIIRENLKLFDAIRIREEEGTRQIKYLCSCQGYVQFSEFTGKPGFVCLLPAKQRSLRAAASFKAHTPV